MPHRTATRVTTLTLAAALCASAAAAQPAPPTITRAADPYLARVRDALHARAPALRTCFARALQRDPTLTARTDGLRFRVLPTGRVRAIEVRVVPRAPALERCMAAVLERMVLPPHPGGPIEVDFPLNE